LSGKCVLEESGSMKVEALDLLGLIAGIIDPMV